MESKVEKLQYFLFVPKLGKDGKQVTMNPAYDEWVLYGRRHQNSRWDYG